MACVRATAPRFRTRGAGRPSQRRAPASRRAARPAAGAAGARDDFWDGLGLEPPPAGADGERVVSLQDLVPHHAAGAGLTTPEELESGEGESLGPERPHMSQAYSRLEVSIREGFEKAYAEGSDPLARPKPPGQPSGGQDSNATKILKDAKDLPVSAYSAEGGFREVSPSELASSVVGAVAGAGGGGGAKPLVLDVRERAECVGTGVVPGARVLPFSELSGAVRAGELDDFRSTAVYTVCASGERSSQAAVRLAKVFGFKDVTTVRGGMRAWLAEGLPTITPGP